MKTRTMLILFVFSLFIFSTFNYFRSYDTTFKSGTYIYWYGFEPFVLSVLLFLLIKRIKTDNFPGKPLKLHYGKFLTLHLEFILFPLFLTALFTPYSAKK